MGSGKVSGAALADEGSELLARSACRRMRCHSLVGSTAVPATTTLTAAQLKQGGCRARVVAARRYRCRLVSQCLWKK